MGFETATTSEMKKAWDILKETGAYREGHFLFKGTGFHYDKFFQLPLAYQYSQNARILSVTLCRIMRRMGILSRLKKDKRLTIVTPSDVGIPIAFWTGECLGADRILWMPKINGKYGFHQFVEIGEEDQVFLVSDILFTGTQMATATEIINKTGASIELIAVIVDRMRQMTDFSGIDVISLLQAQSAKHSPESCPMCKDKKELIEVQLG